MNGVLRHLRNNVVAYVALFVALCGTGYAAANLPRNSVGAPQLRKHAITASKLNPKSIAGSIRAWVNVQWRGSRLVANGSSSRVRIATVSDGEGITWPHRHFGRRCMPMVTPQSNLAAGRNPQGSATAEFEPRSRGGALLVLKGFSPNGTPAPQAAYVAILCPTT